MTFIVAKIQPGINLAKLLILMQPLTMKKVRIISRYDSQDP